MRKINYILITICGLAIALICDYLVWANVYLAKMGTFEVSLAGCMIVLIFATYWLFLRNLENKKA